jgi:hypothetical protein
MRAVGEMQHKNGVTPLNFTAHTKLCAQMKADLLSGIWWQLVDFKAGNLSWQGRRYWPSLQSLLT